MKGKSIYFSAKEIVLLEEVFGDIDDVDFKTEEEKERLEIFNSILTKLYNAKN